MTPYQVRSKVQMPSPALKYLSGLYLSLEYCSALYSPPQKHLCCHNTPLPALEVTLLFSCHLILSDSLSLQCFLPFVLLPLFTCFRTSSNPTVSRSPSRSPGWNPSLLLPLWMLKAPTAFWTEICMNLWKSTSTLWSVACQALMSVGFPRQEYWGGLPFLSPGDLPDPRNTHVLPWQADSLPLSHQGSPIQGKKTFNVPLSWVETLKNIKVVQ